MNDQSLQHLSSGVVLFFKLTEVSGLNQPDLIYPVSNQSNFNISPLKGDLQAPASV